MLLFLLYLFENSSSLLSDWIDLVSLIMLLTKTYWLVYSFICTLIGERLQDNTLNSKKQVMKDCEDGEKKECKI